MASPAPSPRFLRPNWVEVSLPALRHNFQIIRQFVAPHATVCAVVKADAYGHGAVDCARALQQEGATWFGVTSTEEGITLRQAGITARILLMTGFWRGDEDKIVAHDLTPAIWECEQVEALEQAAAHVLGRPSGSKIAVHLKLDTGMARLGMQPHGLPQFLTAMGKAQHVLLEGVFSHLASAEVVDASDVDAQMARFDEALTLVQRSGYQLHYCHVANSAAIITRPASWKNMVRPGLSLYGYYLPVTSTESANVNQAAPALALGPGSARAAWELPVEPVLTWKTRVIALKDVPARQRVGYNGAYVTSAPTRLAILPVGYADGLTRLLSSRGRVILRDHYAPIVGNVSMDMTEADVTAIPGVQVGDEVILIGSSEHCTVSAWEHAHHAKTVPYEILCGIGRRVPRIYLE